MVQFLTASIIILLGSSARGIKAAEDHDGRPMHSQRLRKGQTPASFSDWVSLLFDSDNQKADTNSMIEALQAEKVALEEEIEKDDELLALLLENGAQMSMETQGPTDEPASSPTAVILDPATLAPSDIASAIDPAESLGPSTSSSPSFLPTVSSEPSESPSASSMPSSNPSTAADNEPNPSDSPSSSPSASPSAKPSSRPSVSPSGFPSVSPTVAPSALPSASPTSNPTISTMPSDSPTEMATVVPTIPGCGETPVQRSTSILAQLDAFSNPDTIRDSSTPQGLATQWIIGEDGARLCSNDDKLVQRWVMAVIYFSTGGNEWTNCSATGTDSCGSFGNFDGKQRFLSPVSECQWAGLSCNSQNCITEIEFERNNLVGTIPTEIGLLDTLAIWGMERGGLTGPVPTQIASLTNLVFIDLDFNDLTGTLPDALYTLTNLNQLDLNNNRFAGQLKDVGSFPELEFLQIHSNLFTGTIPETIGLYTNLETFTLHETDIGGAIPKSICDLRAANLTVLVADCINPDPGFLVNMSCTCCSGCF